METYENWVVVYTATSESEADLIKGKLESAGVSAVVLSQQDHSFYTTMGELALVRVLVAKSEYTKAQEFLKKEGITPESEPEKKRRSSRRGTR